MVSQKFFWYTGYKSWFGLESSCLLLNIMLNTDGGESIRCFCNSRHSKNSIYCQVVKWLSRKSGIYFFQVTRENITFYNHLEFPASNSNLQQCRREAHQLMGIMDELCASCSKSGCIVTLCTPVTRLSQTVCIPFLFLRPKYALSWAYSWCNHSMNLSPS